MSPQKLAVIKKLQNKHILIKFSTWYILHVVFVFVYCNVRHIGLTVASQNCPPSVSVTH